jgi:hypothetical protein
MGTGKPRINTAGRLAEKVARLELALAQAAAPERDPVVEPALVPVDRVSVEATGRVVVERKISGRVIGPVAEPVLEISVAPIALAVARVRVPAARVAGSARCRRTARVGAGVEIASEIAASHPAQGSDRVATLLVAVDLTQAPLDRPAVVEAPAWAAVDSAVVVVEEAAVAVAAEGAVGKQII